MVTNLALGLLGGIAAQALHLWVTKAPGPKKGLLIYNTPLSRMRPVFSRN